MYELGRSTPIDAVVSLICREFGVSEAWLKTGAGEVFAVKSRDEEVAEAVNRLLTGEPAEFRRRLVLLLSRLDVDQWEQLQKYAAELVEQAPAVPVTTVRDGQEVIRGMTRAEYHARLDRQLDAEKEEDRQRIQALPQSGKGVSGNGSPSHGPDSTETGGGVA